MAKLLLLAPCNLCPPFFIPVCVFVCVLKQYTPQNLNHCIYIMCYQAHSLRNPWSIRCHCPYLCSPTAELIDQIMGWRNGPLATYQLRLPSIVRSLRHPLNTSLQEAQQKRGNGAIFQSHYFAIWLRFVHQKALFATATGNRSSPHLLRRSLINFRSI